MAELFIVLLFKLTFSTMLKIKTAFVKLYSLTNLVFISDSVFNYVNFMT